jgi:exodeoxyribonuclease VII small subunit
MTDPTQPHPLTFEQALTQIQEIVDKLESGSLTLDESLVLYEKGQRLTRWCQTLLDNAELRIEQISTGGEE